MMRRLVSCLDAVQAGNATQDDLRGGFETVIDMPRRCALFGSANFVIGSAVLVAGMFFVSCLAVMRTD